MTEYPKIQTVYLRDPATNHKTLLMGQYALPEFSYLADNYWTFTEKVDGTNIRVMASETGETTFGGKTDKAQTPPSLLTRLEEIFFPNRALLASMFQSGACLYGEGYGEKIQKGGGNYCAGQNFVLFDVKVGPHWLMQSDVDEIAYQLELDSVPSVGVGTLTEMVRMAQNGFKSRWGDFTAEGIVAKPCCPLLTRAGHRIITKIKHKDFT